MTVSNPEMRTIVSGLSAMRAATAELTTQLRKFGEIRRELRQRVVSACSGGT